MSYCQRLLARDLCCAPLKLNHGESCSAYLPSATSPSRLRTVHRSAAVQRPALRAMTAQANGSITHYDGGESTVGEAVVAIVTPFTPNGELDEEALEAYLLVSITRCSAVQLTCSVAQCVFYGAQHLHRNNVRHIVVNGYAATQLFQFLCCCRTSALPGIWLASGWTVFNRVVPSSRTTGEFWAMTLDERQRVAAAARRHFPGKIIVNVSACALGDVHTLLEHCMAESKVLAYPWYLAMHATCLLAAAATALLHAARQTPVQNEVMLL